MAYNDRFMKEPGAGSPWVARTCWVFAIVIMAIFGGLVYFSQPIADDFCRASDGPLWPAILHHYRESDGRWATTIVGIVVAEHIDLVRDYAAILAALVILRLLAAYALTRTVLGRQVSRRRCAVISGSFCILYWSAMPAVGDALFWLHGAIIYELTATGVMFFFAYLLRRRLNGVRAAWLAIGAVILTGSHEVAALFLTAAVAGGCFLKFRERSADWPWWAALLAVTAGGLALETFAPGNFARAARSGGAHSLLAAGSTTALNVLAWIPRWTLDAPVLLACCVLLMDPDIRLRADWTPPSRQLQLVLAGICAFSLIAGFLIPGWATGGVIPGRLLDFLYLLFLTALLANLLLWKAGRKPEIASTVDIRGAVTALLFVAMFAAGNPWLGAADLRSAHSAMGGEPARRARESRNPSSRRRTSRVSGPLALSAHVLRLRRHAESARVSKPLRSPLLRPGIHCWIKSQ